MFPWLVLGGYDGKKLSGCLQCGNQEVFISHLLNLKSISFSFGVEFYSGFKRSEPGLVVHTFFSFLLSIQEVEAGGNISWG